MKTQTTVDTTNNGLRIKIVITNEGDETAYNIQIHVNENTKIQSSPVKQHLAVKECFAYEFHYNLTQIKHGRYPLIITVDYTDVNQYPFTATTAAYYSFGSDTVSQVCGLASDIRLTNYTTIPLLLRNIDELPKEVHLCLIVPKELSVQEKNKKVILQPRSELNTTFGVSNFSALPGSRYQVFFILEYEDESRHYCSVVPCFINTDVPRGFFRKYRWYIIAGSSLLFVVLIVFQFIPGKSSKPR